MKLLRLALGLALLGVAVPQSTLTDFTVVQTDLKALFTNSQSWWPADFGNYGPFFIRLAWHCSGSYRTSDGRGGCDGGRQRFEPERSWADNTNLDKARKLLQPIKIKYGDALSWGDLIVLAGTTAIESMGGPVLGFCGGRIDDADGTASLPLGPTAEQRALFNCSTDGNCTAPLGPTTLGLIYVNPEGPFGVPDPAGSAPQVRDTFGRMAFNDAETVALIGGGHAFGKTHGACTLGAGPSPAEQPDNPWPGLCGNGTSMGKGNNTFTSGFEGPWTTTPTVWSNKYFTNLLTHNWTVGLGPGGKNQWHHTANDSSTMMLTADISLTNDTNYLAIVQNYASNLTALEDAFKHAWYKLMTRDMGPVSRCTGNLVPAAQAFQDPLPDTPSNLANFATVKSLISSYLGNNTNMLASVMHLTYRCAATFRQTDYHGGCNGARIRFSPQNTWQVNNGTSYTLAALTSNVMLTYTGVGANCTNSTQGALSYADMIVLAGQTAVEQASGLSLTFCSGRTDATDGGANSAYLAPRVYNDSDVGTTILNVKDLQVLSGLTPRQFVALQARLRTDAIQQAIGYSGAWGGSSTTLSNAYFTTLLNNSWTHQLSTSGLSEWVATSPSGSLIYMTPTDIALLYDSTFLPIVQEYDSNNTLFLNDFATAWTTLVNIDRFSGPNGNVCTNTVQAVTPSPTTSTPSTSSPTASTNTFSQASVVGGVFGGFAAACVVIGVGAFLLAPKKKGNGQGNTAVLLDNDHERSK